jgi:hypothetical protein
MHGVQGDDDDTIRVRAPAPGSRKNSAWARGIAVAALAIVLIAGAGWYAFSGPAPFPIDTETETQIDATQPCSVTVSRLEPDPAVVVIDFPNLYVQGLMLDRVAALIEKAKLPRDRVLNDVELNEAIANCGATIETYYYGHDYKAADLAKFFRLAAADGVQLNPDELWLKRLMRQLGWLKPGANGALITLPGAASPITEEMRAVILHHEISHGAFFTIPAYEAYAVSFWNSLTDAQRTAFTHFLGSEDYDTTNTNLMLNETQAYLVFTRDPRFFNANAVGMTDAELDQLRDRYIAGMADFWLKSNTGATLPVGPEPASACPVGIS